MLVKRITQFDNIDPKTWEHPADKAALSALKRLKGFDELIKLLVSVTTERSLKLMALSSAVKVSPNQYPRLYRLLHKVADTFDWDYRPDLFVTQNPFWNAGVMGVKEPFMLINSSMVKHFDEKELEAVIAHELAHIMSGHALYKTLLWLLTKVSVSLIPLGSLLLTPILLALCEWDRKSELTADRAEVLALQEPSVSYTLLMKLSGAEELGEVNLNDFFAQAQEYENQKTLLDGVHKLLNQLWASHPFPVIRLKELRTWELSGSYQAILEGNYLKRGQGSGREDMRAGYEYYRNTWKNKDDPLSKVAYDVSEELGKAAEGLGKAVEGIGETFKDLFKGAP